MDYGYLLTELREQDRSILYDEPIQRLRDKFAELIPGATQIVRTYWDEDTDIHEDLQGAIIVQYTPYDRNGGDSGCDPQARVRVFYENNQEAVIDHTWSARANQLTKRQACKLFCLVDLRAAES